MNFSRYLLWLRRYKRKSLKVGVFQRVGDFEHKFETEGFITHQPVLVSEN